MRSLRQATPIVTVAVALAGVTCAFPTDKSDKVFVTLQAPSHVVLRGQEVSVYAQAWRVIGADTQSITNVDFAFASGSGLVARVDKNCCGYATVTGVNSGNVDIIARAVGFEKAQEADLSLRVSNPLEIDSVRPSTARYGEVVTVYGIGVDSMFLASLAGVNLIEYPFSRLRDTASGRARISFWVPPPARPDHLAYLGRGVFGLDTARTIVLPADVYEPNDTVPSVIDLNGPGPWPGTIFAPILFANPALAFEATPRGVGGADWFDFVTADSTSDYTFLINYPSVGDTSATRTFLLDSLRYAGAYLGRDSADYIGSDLMRCKGLAFSPSEASRESTVVALRGLPSHSIHVVTFFQVDHARRYGLTVVKGYLTADPRIKPDKYEPNRFCHYADFGNRNLGLATGFSDTLTIDNAFAVDWLRVAVPAAQTIRIRTDARPFPAEADTSDIDLYVLTVPNSGTGTGLNVVAADTAPGSLADVSVTAPVSPAQTAYYIAVVDFAGVPTRYSLCFQRALLPGACTPLPASPLPAPPAFTTPPRVRRTGPRRPPAFGPMGPGASLFRRPPAP